jgi:hypothetical protein
MERDEFAQLNANASIFLFPWSFLLSIPGIGSGLSDCGGRFVEGFAL